MKTLKKITHGLLGLSMLAVYGCETPTGMGAMGTLMQVSPYSNSNERAMGAVLSTVGQMEHEKEVAREGRSQVNVYGGERRNENDYQCINYIVISDLETGKKEKTIVFDEPIQGVREAQEYMENSNQKYRGDRDNYPERGYLAKQYRCNKYFNWWIRTDKTIRMAQ